MFIQDDFLLKSDTARQLYHQYAKDLPIVDYHNHLNAQEIHDNISYRDLTEAWLSHDHYKWRIMRGNGIEEELITGSGDQLDKFMAFTSSIERAIMNPVSHFSHLELKRFFDIDDTLNLSHAQSIWEKANTGLETMKVQDMLKKMKVEMLCTTDDPLDDLDYHGQVGGISIRPTFRPDKALKLDVSWFERLSNGHKLETFSALMGLLEERISYFKDQGCLLSDHSLEGFKFAYDHEQNLDVLTQKLFSDTLREEEKTIMTTMIMVALGKLYHKYDMVMQVHIGALRNNSSRQHRHLGVDKGFDAMNDQTYIVELSKLMSCMDETDQLPKTILYNINPSDNALVATLAASFNSSPHRGKVQFGPAWWFNDNYRGIRDQLTDLANHGVLGNFIGMVTDSRSYLSFVRHEYFRRVLCDLLGQWSEAGMIEQDIRQLGQLVEDICYNNIKNYLNLGV